MTIKTLLFLGLVSVFGLCLFLFIIDTADAVNSTDTWQVGPNCKGVNNTPQHRCDFVPTQVKIGNDNTLFDQWNLIAIEPGVVTDVSCQTFGSNLFEFRGAVPPRSSKRNPFPGEYYGNVAICKGWINGANGPVKMTVAYRRAVRTKKKAPTRCM
jgi:hypothetical protein